MTKRRGPRNDHGAVLVELVMVLPVLISVLLGTITSGQAYFQKIGVLEATREGARYGASLLLGTGPTAMANWESSVRTRVAEQSGGALAAADVCAKLVLPTGGTDCGSKDPSGASAESTIHLVKVSATKSTTIEFFFFRTTSTLNARLAARYERDTG